jgi:hypothetical protein
MNIALFAPIEPDLKDINTTKIGYTRYYEQEAIKSFLCWRENGGWLKDIPIYVMCPTGKNISDETKKKFYELNVTYIEEYLNETSNFDCGFWNIPLVGKWAEKNLVEDILIKIDLDMYLIRPLKKEMFDNLDKSVVGRHGPFPASFYLDKMSEKFPEYKNFYNTGFTITEKKSNFFHKQMEALERCTLSYKKNTFEKDFGLIISEKDNDNSDNSFPYFLLEELCVSIMEKEGVPIKPIDMFYLETDWDEIDEMKKLGMPYNINEIFFIHEHIDTKIDQNKIKNKLKYKKTLNGLKGYEFYLKLFNSTSNCN